MSNIEIKIGLLGNSGVGKTSLIRRFVVDKYEDNFISTIGVDYFDKELIINNKKIKLLIQDSSGQERFRSISKNYYKNVNGMIFVFDVTNSESFNEGIKYWLTECDNEIKDCKKILVGNKIDLREDMRGINQEKAQKFAESKQMKYFETSAKTGTNVNIIFKELVELILRDLKVEEGTKNNKLLGNKNSSKKNCC